MSKSERFRNQKNEATQPGGKKAKAEKTSRTENGKSHRGGPSEELRKTKAVTPVSSTATEVEKEIIGGSDNSGSAEMENVVSSVSDSKNSETSQEKTKMELTLNRVVKEGRKSKSLVFAGPGLRGTVRFPASSFATVPDSISISAEGLATGGGKPKMTKEERAALRASMTPEQKAAAAAERKDARIAKAKKLLGIA